MNSPGPLRAPYSNALYLASWSDPKSGIRPFLVKPSLVHTWSNVLSWTKVPKDLLIKQIPTLEVGSSRLETLSRSRNPSRNPSFEQCPRAVYGSSTGWHELGASLVTPCGPTARRTARDNRYEERCERRGVL